MNRLSIREQIDELNQRVMTYLAPSSINGVGVFALRDISKGQTLYADAIPKIYTLTYSNFGKLYTEVGKHLLERWPRVVNGEAFAYPTERAQTHMNHSNTPNYDGITDILLVDVKRGEEITEDYRQIEGWKRVYPWLRKDT